jgi:hypothetical protein
MSPEEFVGNIWSLVKLSILPHKCKMALGGEPTLIERSINPPVVSIYEI